MTHLFRAREIDLGAPKYGDRSFAPSEEKPCGFNYLRLVRSVLSTRQTIRQL